MQITENSLGSCSRLVGLSAWRMNSRTSSANLSMLHATRSLLLIDFSGLKGLFVPANPALLMSLLMCSLTCSRREPVVEMSDAGSFSECQLLHPGRLDGRWCLHPRSKFPMIGSLVLQLPPNVAAGLYRARLRYLTLRYNLTESQMQQDALSAAHPCLVRRPAFPARSECP
jgi:hypothetical protein